MNLIANRPNDYAVDTIRDAIHNLEDFHDILYRDMNYFERKKYEELDHHFYVSQYIAKMHEKLVLRNQLGYWDSLDDEVYKHYVEMSSDLLYTIEKEKFRLQGMDIDSEMILGRNDFSLIFSTVDIEQITDKYWELNLLAACYVKYTDLPENVEILSEENITKRLDELFSDSAEYRFNSLDRKDILIFNSIFETIQVDMNEISYYLDIEAVNGNVVTIHDRFNSEGKPKNDIYLIEDVESVLTKLFGSDASYQIKYLKKSNTFSSDQDYYSYEFIPLFDGYPISYGKVKPEIHFSVSNFDAYSYFEVQYIPTGVDIGENRIIFSKDEALSNVFQNQTEYLIKKFNDDITIDQFTYETTAIKYSFATGKYDLMHVYSFIENNQQLYIHAINSIAE